METLLQDLRYALHMLARSLAFTSVAVLTLAIGIGATTAIFSVADHVVLRDLPYSQADRVVTLWETDRIKDERHKEVSPGNFLSWSERAASFEALGLAEPSGVDLTGEQPPVAIPSWDVTDDFFDALGVRPILGPGFDPAHFETGGPAAVMISYGLWQRRYGGAPAAVGDTIEVNGAPATVVGVLPPWLQYPEARDIWTPKRFRQEELGDRVSGYMFAVARLAAGRTAGEAQAELDAVAASLGREYPRTNVNTGVGVVPLSDEIVGDVRHTLFILLGAVAFLLLIACANVAHLVLARAAGRRHELSVRASLGANRARLVRQLITESLVLAAFGGLAGIALSAAGIEAIIALSPPDFPRIGAVAIDGRVLAFAALVTAATAVVFGVAPALRLSRPDARAARAGGLQTPPESARARNALVVAEIAVAMVLLVGAGLLIRSFAALVDNPLGFGADRRVTMQLFIWDRNQTAAERIARVAEIDERFEALAGVERAAVISAFPFHPTRILRRMPVAVAGEPTDEAGDEAVVLAASPDYFRTMGIPLLDGRVYAESVSSDGPPLAVINETLARSRFGSRDAVGGRLVLGNGTAVEVVGVVGDVRSASFASEPDPELYIPYDRSGTGSVTLVVQTDGDAATMVPLLRNALWHVDPGQSIYHEATVEQLVSATLVERRFHLLLIGGFAAIALLLCAIGVFGVISFATSCRRREIGIRMAVGARAQDMLGMVARHAAVLAMAGVVLGAVASFMLSQLLAGMLYGVSATDPATFIVTALLLIAVAQLACFIPARRAARFDPMTALRAE